MNNLICTFRPIAGLRFIVEDHQTALLFRHGRFVRTLDAGTHRLWKGGHEVKRIDSREQMLVVQGQELLTADQVAIKVSALATFQVVDALKMYRATDDAIAMLYTEIQLALRQIVAPETAEAFLQTKAAHGAALLTLVTERAAELGLAVHRIDIRDVMLPADLKRSFMSAIQQRQEAQASLEKARAETAALRTLANAAKLMRDNPELLQLRYLQTLQEVGTSMGNTLVLGLTDSERLKAITKM